MTIRSVMAVLGVCLGGVAAVDAAGMGEAERAELLAVRESAWYAWFGNDQARLRELLPPDALTIGAGDPTWHDREGVLRSAAAFAATGQRMTRLAFPRTEVQLYGDTAFVYSLYELELDGPDGQRSLAGRATEIFVRQDGRWIHPGWHLDAGS